MNRSEVVQTLPTMEALVAGTFALMTTWADPHLTNEAVMTRQRDLIARKIISNLYFLKTHPAASDDLRAVLGRAHDRWLSLAGGSGCTCKTHGTDPAIAPLLALPGSLLIH